MNAARRWLAKKQGVSEAEVAPILAGVEIPDPVFFCSIETASLVTIAVSSKFSLCHRFIKRNWNTHWKCFSEKTQV